MNISFDFSGKNVFIMGGTSGINLGIAEAFASSGARVGVASRSKEKVSAAIERLSSLGQTATGFAADVRDVETLASGFEKIAEEWGVIDVLVAGQAGNFPAPATGMSSNAFKSVIDIDLLGTFNVVRHAHQYLSRPGSNVITISAPQAFVPMRLQSHVCAAKAGVDMLTRVLALEWGGDGIRVNAIVPGPIADTEGMKRLAPTPEALDKVRESVPMKRLGMTDDIANCAMFLASPLADYINGAMIPVDGGQCLSGAESMLQEVIKEQEKASPGKR